MKKTRISLYLIILTAVLFYLLGIVSLRSGFVKKTYDFFFAINYPSRNLVDFNSDFRIDTFEIRLSKKKLKGFYKLRADSFLFLKNYINPSWQWIGERPWIKAEVRLGENKKGDVDIKLIGMNSDHFRDEGNLSVRVKGKNDYYLFGYEKYNLVNPHSRGFFVDYFYNQLYREIGGLYIDYRPLFTKFNNQFSLKLFEPFYSKDLIEFNKYRDGLILSLDKSDPAYLGHLKIVHPSRFENLSLPQKRIYQYYDSIANFEKLFNYFNLNDLSFLIATSIANGGDTHHNYGFNLFFYVDPVKGELKPFIREVSLFEPMTAIPRNYSDVKNDVYRRIKIDSTLSNYDNLNDLVDKMFLFIYENKPLNFLSKKRSTNNFTSSILSNSFNARIYFDKILYPIKQLPDTFTKINNRKSKLIFEHVVTLTDTILRIPSNVELTLMPGLQLNMKNSVLLLEGNVKSFINSTNVHINGDSLSTIIFKSDSISLYGVHFKGFGSKINNVLPNYDVTSAITFVDAKVNIHNCSFSDNFSGDDILNLIRCDFIINNISIGNAIADALDIDGGCGVIKNSKFYNSVNDGLDIGAANVYLQNTSVFKCKDKGISIGENSFVSIENFSIFKNSIGIAIKDGSELSLYSGKYENNQVDLVAYGKKSKFDAPNIKKIKVEPKLKYLIEPDVLVNSDNPVKRTRDILKLMYGKVYGNASVR
jgi:hypothetical protein